MISLLSKGLSRVFSNITVQKHQFFHAQPSLWSIALTRWAFGGKVMSLIFNMLSRLVTVFLPRSKHLLIPWLQSPSTVVLEPPEIKPLTVCITKKLWNILREMGIPDHFTCLLRNLYPGQEATVITGHVTGLVPNWKRSISRLYTDILHI